MSASSSFDRYLHWPELVERIEALAERAPSWIRLEPIGQSREGREIPLVTVGDRGAGPVDERPGFWLDAGTHAAEWAGVMAALYALERWVEGLEAGEDELLGWFRSHTAYVLPCMSPDGYAALHDGAPFLRSTLRPARDGRPRVGLRASDVDGDGEVRWMRWRHPSGNWMFDDPDNPAKMRRRKLDDDPERAFVVCTEGTFLEWDGVRWTESGWEFALDLNRNFPASWTPFEMFGMDAGDYPLSEPESRAVVDAFRARPRIAAALTNHTYTGCLLTPPYRKPSALPEADLDLMSALADAAVEGTGYRVFKILPEFTYDENASIIGVWADTMSSTFGVAGYTLELWDPYGFAGETVDKPAELFKKPDEELLHRVLDAFKEEPGAIRAWEPFEHPQLGAIEIGGISYMNTIRNPPERLLSEECQRAYTVADRLRRALPSVRASASTERLAEGVTRVELLLENLGYLPTSGLRRAEDVGLAPPVHVEIEGLDLAEGRRHQDLGWLDGWGSLQRGAHPIYPSLSHDRGARTRATWVVRGEGALRLVWDAGRGGRGVVELSL